jgi:signal transduction histidine kinase
MALPIRARKRSLGILHLGSGRRDDFSSSDEMVFQSLADQVGVAIENARAYALERETVERLRELDRIQSQFLTNMSHALRTPLNSVIGFSRVLLKELDGPLTELQRDDLMTVHKSGRQLLGLINDMLELTHLELGTAPFSSAEVNLVELVEGVMATARALALGKPVQLVEEVPQDLPLLYTDGQRVRQVILALLSNAVKFTDEGKIWLRVTADDGHVAISVRDTGIGIAALEQARIFSDVGYSEANDPEDIPRFGLAISKRVVEKLGGQIWIESEAGVGSALTFTLPIRLATGRGLPSGRHQVEAQQGTT